MNDQLRPVLTVFAGPNGSGKSTLQRHIAASGYDLGTFVNADQIALSLLHAAGVVGQTKRTPEEVKAIEAIEIAAFWLAAARREHLLTDGQSFSFETVFSHESKVDFLQRARSLGYIVRVYFVSTENSRLNVARVAKRVEDGGHDVPVEKIINRYRRSMANIITAFESADEVALFDNSSQVMRLVVGFQRSVDGKPHFEIHTPVPVWVMHVLEAVSLRLSGLDRE